jgi:hypothetical protein
LWKRPSAVLSLFDSVGFVLSCFIFVSTHSTFLRMTVKNGTCISVRLFPLFALQSISRCHICVFLMSNFSQFFLWLDNPNGPGPSVRGLTITFILTHHTGRTPLDE